MSHGSSVGGSSLPWYIHLLLKSLPWWPVAPGQRLASHPLTWLSLVSSAP